MDFVHHERLYDGRNAATRTDDHMPADMMRQARGHGDDYVHHERLYDGRYAHTKTDDHMSASMMRQLHGPGVDHVHHERLYDGRNAHTRTDDHMSSEMMRQLHGPAVDHVHHERLFDGSKVASRTVTHPTPPKLVSLWKANQLCDTTIKMSADGSSFAAHRVVLASGSTYFEGLFQSERSDANAPALAEVPASVFEPLLQFLYEGRCSCGQSILTPLLRAANYLGVKPLELSIGTALQARLLPSNAFALWTLAEEAMLPLLEEAAKSLALSKFEEVKESLAEEASWDQVHALVSSDQLAARGEETVFEAVVQYAEAQRPEEERLLALMRRTCASR